MSDRQAENTNVADDHELQLQQNIWLAQSSAAPDMKCRKDRIVTQTKSLLRAIRDQGAVKAHQEIPDITGADGSPKPWRQFQGALRVMGLTETQGDEIRLTAKGKQLADEFDPALLGELLIRRVRYFGEILHLISGDASTIKEVHNALVTKYRLEWRSDGNTRLRVTWMEVLGLVEWSDAYHIAIAPQGQLLLNSATLISPEAIAWRPADIDLSLTMPPEPIEALIDRLRRNPAAMNARTTYNIWVPSPASDPSKIANMDVCIRAAIEPIDKEELLTFIASRFRLKRSSVDSMLPFMRAGGFVQEVRKGVYVATPEARAWLKSESPLDFIRILHCHLRYVGELVRTVEKGAQRSDVYLERSRHGMNKEKCRWIIAFLLDADLIIETSWTGLEATATGRALAGSLPLSNGSLQATETTNKKLSPEISSRSDSDSRLDDAPISSERIAKELVAASIDPSAAGMASGQAFELSIEVAFELLGFDARRVGGSGNSDVVLQWRNAEGELRVASVDAKSSASRTISHTNISDVALSAHASKDNANYVAIIAPGFTGNTITNMALEKGWSLITASELATVLCSSISLGLRPAEVGLMLESPDGLSKLNDLIEGRQREMDIVSLVVARLQGESASDEGFSPRDISLIERSSKMAPTIDEIISAMDTLKSLQIGAVVVEMPSQEPKHETYLFGDVQAAAHRMRALANALERGLDGLDE